MRLPTQKLESKMLFETEVLDKVAPILETNERAEFNYGTLFVTCSEDRVRSIYHKLTTDYGFNKVRLSTCGEEYAFDFVA